MRKLFFIFFLLFTGTTFSQDTTFIKIFYAGSTVKVPEGKLWTVEKAFISSGDGYNIRIADSNFKSPYEEGEALSIPYYIAEMELLSDRSNVSYTLSIRESKR
jgi:hypothetical protein